MKSPARQGGSAQGTVYVDMKQEKFLFPDNRRGIRFFVVDANGKSTLAVLGEERDTRDGHYTYRKQPDFPAGSNLVCGNLSGVHNWIRNVMIESGCAEAQIDFKPSRRGSALGGAAESSHHKKNRYLKEEVDRLVSRARELEQSNINLYTTGIRTARSTANAWLKDCPGTPAFFENALAGVSHPKASQETILTNLRALCDAYVPLHLLDSTNAYEVVSEVEKNQDSEAVRRLCTQVKDVWRLQLRKALIVGTTPWDEYPIVTKQTYGPMSTPAASNKRSGVHHSGNSASKSQKSSGKTTGIGKGRKICHHCNQIVGSPSRICPFCKGELPLKTTPKSER